ncbi:MAG: helix-turn-helix domain-containing protein [Methanomethylovorans sp.]|uniref:helix-turn-helix domain-containing protein n=1 Tax=Methanomethylovorans sp. TaxID=2758717 RepID=UPI000AA56FAD|nr:helix-turn-helix domain-containing protein [Methanomethylovorans sp.]
MASSIHEMLRANCKCDDVAKCVLGLKNLDLLAYKKLFEYGPMTAEELGDLLQRERSTAYRSLQNLIAVGLVYRETRSIQVGGYYYEYVAIPPEKFKQMLRQNIAEWYNKIDKLLDNFEKELLEPASE